MTLDQAGEVAVALFVTIDPVGAVPPFIALTQDMAAHERRIAGGLLFLLASDMLFEKRTERRGRQAEGPPPEPTVFPVATPLIAGPGALAAMVLFAGGHPGAVGVLELNAILAAIMALCLGLFLADGAVPRLLGRTGITVVTRLLGILLAASRSSS